MSLEIRSILSFPSLRNSFDSLRGECRMVFMDLALLIDSSLDDDVFKVCRRDWLCMVHEESAEDMKNMLEVLRRKSLLEDLSDDFSKIGIHDLWIEFAVAESKAQDSRDQRWVYQADGRRGALGRRGRFRESVERMCFLNEGWKGLNGLELDDFVNVEAFKLQVGIRMADCALDLDLSGLKQLKSLELFTPGLIVRADGLSSLTNLASLFWFTPGYSPCLDATVAHRVLQRQRSSLQASTTAPQTPLNAKEICRTNIPLTLLGVLRRKAGKPTAITQINSHQNLKPFHNLTQLKQSQPNSTKLNQSITTDYHLRTLTMTENEPLALASTNPKRILPTSSPQNVGMRTRSAKMT